METGRILDIKPEGIHQRTPFCVGSKREMEALERSGGSGAKVSEFSGSGDGYSRGVAGGGAGSAGRWRWIGRSLLLGDVGVLEAVARSGARLVVPVLGVVMDAAGEVWHVVEKPLAAGTTVTGRVGRLASDGVIEGLSEGCLLVHSERLFDGVAPAKAVCDARLVGGCSSAGRAPRSQRGGQRFDPAQLHQIHIRGCSMKS